MELTNYTNRLSHSFHADSEKVIHSQDIHSLVQKLKSKEKTIRNKFDNEKDETKRNKHKRSLSVLQAQQSKAEKMLQSCITE